MEILKASVVDRIYGRQVVLVFASSHCSSKMYRYIIIYYMYLFKPFISHMCVTESDGCDICTQWKAIPKNVQYGSIMERVTDHLESMDSRVFLEVIKDTPRYVVSSPIHSFAVMALWIASSTCGVSACMSDDCDLLSFVLARCSGDVDRTEGCLLLPTSCFSWSTLDLKLVDFFFEI